MLSERHAAQASLVVVGASVLAGVDDLGLADAPQTDRRAADRFACPSWRWMTLSVRRRRRALLPA
jgi:hypothetical protein